MFLLGIIGSLIRPDFPNILEGIMIILCCVIGTKGGLAKGEKNKLFKEFILQEYNENNDYKTIKEFVNNIVDRLYQGEFEYLKPCFKTTTPETTIRNWITEFRKQKNTFWAKWIIFRANRFKTLYTVLFFPCYLDKNIKEVIVHGKQNSNDGSQICG